MREIADESKRSGRKERERERCSKRVREREGTFIDLPYQEVLYPGLAINQVYRGSPQVSHLLIQPWAMFSCRTLQIDIS
jgi:hypothetical protein